MSEDLWELLEEEPRAKGAPPTAACAKAFVLAFLRGRVAAAARRRLLDVICPQRAATRRTGPEAHQDRIAHHMRGADAATRLVDWPPDPVLDMLARLCAKR